jgi:phospholipid transport system substrate-binding protein
MLTRRTSLTALLGGLALTAGAACLVPTARAQLATDQAAAFVDKTGKELLAVVNGSGSTQEKAAAATEIIDRAVDVEGVGRFCLGRFWRTATPEQQRQYLELFHRVLEVSITSKMGDYQGVRFTLGRAQPRDDVVAVATTVYRPGNPPSKVDWLVSLAGGSPKVVDVMAEGTSLRLTQRDDYTSYLSRNNNSVQALIDAMRKQVNPSG